MDITKLKFEGINITESTKKYYITKFKKIINDVFNGIIPESDYLASHAAYTLVSDYIKSDTVTLATKKPMYNAFIKCLQELNISTDKYLNDYHKVSKQSDEKLALKEPSEDEENKKISFKDLEKIQKKWKKTLIKDMTTVNDIYYMICSLYLLLEPLRTQDYINTHLLDNCKKYDLTKMPNYVCLKCAHLIIREFKTDKIHDQRTIIIPKKLNNIIKQYHKKTKFKYLITSSNGTQLQQPNFYALSVEACGISTNMMRKIFVSEKLNDNLATTKKRANSARIMGHKPSTQAAAYSKFSVLLSDKEDLETLKKKKDLLIKLMMETESAISKK
jgi:hypothetical protein